MASSSFLLSPLSSTTAAAEKNGLCSSASAFLQNPKVLFAAKPRKFAVRRCGLKSVVARRDPFDRIPKQFREENLKEGLMENYKNFPKHLYGLTPSQLDMFMTEDNIFSRMSGNVTPESLSSKNSLMGAGIMNLAQMQKRGTSVSSYRGGGGYGRRRSGPPDLPSIVLDGRIVFLGMPIVSAVAQLIVAQIVWLDYDDPTKPIYFYINSTGTQNANREIVGSETDAYAIVDTLRNVQATIYTVNLSAAYGQAAMLLSLGKKGHRAMLPNATTKIHLPKDHDSSGPSTDMWIKKGEIERVSSYYLELLSEGTGKPIDELERDLQAGRFFNAQKSIDYGLADKIIQPNERSFESRDYNKIAAETKAARLAEARRNDAQPAASGGLF